MKTSLFSSSFSQGVFKGLSKAFPFLLKLFINFLLFYMYTGVNKLIYDCRTNMDNGQWTIIRFYLLPYGFWWCLYPAPPRCPECFDLSRWGSSRLAANVWEPPVQLSRLLLDPVIRPRCLEPYSGPGCVVLSEGRLGWRTVDEPISSSTLAAIVS